MPVESLILFTPASSMAGIHAHYWKEFIKYPRVIHSRYVDSTGAPRVLNDTLLSATHTRTL
jgi:hypothetical protein